VSCLPTELYRREKLRVQPGCHAQTWSLGRSMYLAQIFSTIVDTFVSSDRRQTGNPCSREVVNNTISLLRFPFCYPLPKQWSTWQCRHNQPRESSPQWRFCGQHNSPTVRPQCLELILARTLSRRVSSPNKTPSGLLSIGSLYCLVLSSDSHS
jgi:hypothetical protein